MAFYIGSLARCIALTPFLKRRLLYLWKARESTAGKVQFGIKGGHVNPFTGINHPLRGPFFADKSQRKGIVETISRRKVGTRPVSLCWFCECPHRGKKKKKPSKLWAQCRFLANVVFANTRKRGKENEGTKLFSTHANVRRRAQSLFNPSSRSARMENMIRKKLQIRPSSGGIIGIIPVCRWRPVGAWPASSWRPCS